jgi:hypothetical protein
MSTSRRDLLKIFGAGAIILPANGAEPLARLIEPAKVELVKPDRIVVPINLEEVSEITTSFKMLDGTVRTSRGNLRSGSGMLTGKYTQLVFHEERDNYSPPNVEESGSCSFWAVLS